MYPSVALFTIARTWKQPRCPLADNWIRKLWYGILPSHKKECTCTPMFITALFIIARTWKQPRCPSADEWIRKLWYIHTMEYYSAIKKNTFESVRMRWIKLESII